MADMSEYRRLRREWGKARARLDITNDAADFDAEQKAHDCWIDFVEDNGLNYTKYDPRYSDDVEGNES